MLAGFPEWIPKNLLVEATAVYLPDGNNSLVARIAIGKFRSIIVVKLEEKGKIGVILC